MSTTTIDSITITELGKYVTATCGKISAFVGITELGVQVICQNSSNRAWRGSGKNFPTIFAAVGGYKSPEMKNIILAAYDAAN